MMKYSIPFGSKEVQFDVIRADRRTLGISVKPDSSVYVRAPQDKSIEDILSIVSKRVPWILRQIDRFYQLRPLIVPKEYVSGETFYYLGRQYRLKVLETINNKSVKMSGGYIQVYSDERDENRVKSLMDRWYLSHAKVYFQKKIDSCYDIVKKYDVPFPKVTIRKMKTRWGSCSNKHRITLNTHLIKAPSHSIEYVIMHELCHLKYYNHNKNFYALLNRVLPDWKMRKKRLETVVV